MVFKRTGTRTGLKISRLALDRDWTTQDWVHQTGLDQSINITGPQTGLDQSINITSLQTGPDQKQWKTRVARASTWALVRDKGIKGE